LASFLEHLHAVEILDSYELFREVVLLKVLIRSKSEYSLLFQLTHEDLFHLAMSQFAVVIESESLDTAIIVFLQFYLVLNNFYTRLEDTLVLDGLSNGDFASACA